MLSRWPDLTPAVVSESWEYQDITDRVVLVGDDGNTPIADRRLVAVLRKAGVR